MIEEKTLSFGPKRKGPNILINKFLKKSESFIGKICIQAQKFLGIEIKQVDDPKVSRRQKEDDERFLTVQ
jgi:hypothetical protein